uniref:BAH domain-containing protein n=1 Tax=Pyricularia oryzae (strain P131) TaxID=1143193 RepID=L7ISQ5_PYRO1
MAPCPYRIVYPGPNDGKVAFKRDEMLPGRFIRYGVQNGTKLRLPDWWHLSESTSFTAEDGIIYNRGDFLEVDTGSASYSIAILLEVRLLEAHRKLDGRKIVPESCQKYLRVFWMYRPSDMPAKPRTEFSGLYKSSHMDIINASWVESKAAVEPKPASYYCYKRERLFYLAKRTGFFPPKIQNGEILSRPYECEKDLSVASQYKNG